MGTFFTSWLHRQQEPQAERAHRAHFSVYRRPHYQRPPRPTPSLSQAVNPWTGVLPQPWYAKVHWLTLAISAHIILFGFVASVTLPTRTPGMRAIPPLEVQLLHSTSAIPDSGAPKRQGGQLATPALPASAEAAIANIQRLDAELTARADRLEQTLIQLAEATATQEQTLQRQQQQLAQAQEETARNAEEVARRTTQEEELATRLAEEQARRAQLEAEIAEQQRQQEAALAKTQGTYNALIADLQKEIANKDIIIRETNDKLAINIVDRVLFPSGQATLTAEGTQVLDKVGRVLQTVTDHRIQIEGHTDNQEIGPVLKKTFASNWELSTARATEVVKYFLDHSQLSAGRLVAVGRADTVPVAANTTEEGRQQNRRIEILLLPPERMGSIVSGTNFGGEHQNSLSLRERARVRG